MVRYVQKNIVFLFIATAFKIKLCFILNSKSSYSVQLPGKQVQKLENKKDIYPIVQKYNKNKVLMYMFLKETI